MTKRLKRRSEVAEITVKRLLCCGFRRTGKPMEQVYQCCWRTCREINVFRRIDYHMFYVLYQFVTHFMTLPRNISKMCLQTTRKFKTRVDGPNLIVLHSREKGMLPLIALGEGNLQLYGVESLRRQQLLSYS
jgi:hypothetical protein